jgi:hypothetical protein
MVFLVKEGEFEVQRNRKKDPLGPKEIIDTSYKLIGPQLAGAKSYMQTRGRTIPAKTNASQAVRLTVACSGQILGDEDVINNRKYTTSCKCLTTKAILYCIKADEFLMKFGRDDKTWQMIIRRVYSKDLNTKDKIKK